ncbi:MAG: hypothetical protein ACLRRN_00410 [Oscillospiraceae bacterium]
MKKRIISLLLCLVLIVSLVPAAAAGTRGTPGPSRYATLPVTGSTP